MASRSCTSHTGKPAVANPIQYLFSGNLIYINQFCLVFLFCASLLLLFICLDDTGQKHSSLITYFLHIQDFSCHTGVKRCCHKRFRLSDQCTCLHLISRTY